MEHLPTFIVPFWLSTDDIMVGTCRKKKPTGMSLTFEDVLFLGYLKVYMLYKCTHTHIAYT